MPFLAPNCHVSKASLSGKALLTFFFFSSPLPPSAACFASAPSNDPAFTRASKSSSSKSSFAGAEAFSCCASPLFASLLYTFDAPVKNLGHTTRNTTPRKTYVRILTARLKTSPQPSSFPPPPSPPPPPRSSFPFPPPPLPSSSSLAKRFSFPSNACSSAFLASSCFWSVLGTARGSSAAKSSNLKRLDLPTSMPALRDDAACLLTRKVLPDPREECSGERPKDPVTSL
mmetsp:Transcript_1462/g.5515  ORF Transcript_1462/g.5515 Transcript_1462/m.5515 type:complete len:229 (+) Transcript_1462:1021-1707(+)